MSPEPRYFTSWGGRRIKIQGQGNVSVPELGLSQQITNYNKSHTNLLCGVSYQRWVIFTHNQFYLSQINDLIIFQIYMCTAKTYNKLSKDTVMCLKLQSHSPDTPSCR